jgi:two-component system response regulator HydG
MAHMQASPWPGNVRELENFVERAVIMHSGAASLPFDPSPGTTSSGDVDLVRQGVDQRWTLERLEREYILAVLDETQWRRGDTATLLGINRRTLFRKLKGYEEDAFASSLGHV